MFTLQPAPYLSHFATLQLARTLSIIYNILWTWRFDITPPGTAPYGADYLILVHSAPHCKRQKHKKAMNMFPRL
jgi:hypothetical protein